MGVLTYLFVATLAAAPTVNVVTLAGKKTPGTLQSIDGKSLKLKVTGETTSFPVNELMHVAFPKTTKPKPAKTGIRVILADGTNLVCTQVTSNGKQATLETAAFGKLEIPAGSIASIRFSIADAGPKKEGQWKTLLKKQSAKDLLILDKKLTLDFLPAVVDGITEKDVKFAFGGMLVPRPRTKFFGLVFPRATASTSAKPVCGVELANGDMVQVSKISYTDKGIQATLLSGSDVTMTADKVAKLDFSLGKIKYLSDMEPTDAEVKPFFPDPFVAKLFQYRRNLTNTGKKLQLGKTTYDRGLWIHSRTELKYRIAGEYEYFKAIAGIDQAVAENGKGHVQLIISGDGKKLLETTVRAGDAPLAINLKVSGVTNLTILVDYGENQDTSDHLDLCEARLIK